MVQSKAQTVTEYLASLPDDRKKAISAVRKVVKQNLGKGFKEVMNWGMITYEVPLSVYPDTYNGKPLMFAALGSQKSHMAIYLMCLYSDKNSEKAFRARFKEAGKKLDMGKSCIRFKKLEDLPLDVIGETIAAVSLKDFLAMVEKVKK